MSSVQQQRAVVEQLRREASIKRISVSQAIEDIKVGAPEAKVAQQKLSYFWTVPGTILV